MSDRPTIDERLDRVAGLLETSTQQIAYLSELIVSNSQQAAERDAVLNAKLDRMAEAAAERDAALNAKLDHLTGAIAAFVHQAELRAAAIDARLDRIAATLESQNRTLEGHIQLAQQQAQTVATLTTLVSQLLAARP